MKKAYYELKADNITTLKTERMFLDYEMPVHFHRSLELQYVISGCYKTEVNGESYEFQEDEIIFISSYLPHSAPKQNNVQTILFVIPHLFTNDFQALFQDKTLQIRLPDKQFNRSTVYPVLNIILEHIEQLELPIISKGYMDVVIGNLIRHYGLHEPIKNSNPEFIINLLKYLDLHSNEKITLDELANQYGYNKFYLSRMFNSLIGTSLTNYINQVRIQKFIKLYSENPNQNITALAFNCGFESLPTFYRSFNALYNMNPKNYSKLGETVYW